MHMKHLKVALLMGALAAAIQPVQARQILFSDTFETDTSARWNVVGGSDSGTPDYTAAFSFLYTTNRYTLNGTASTIPLAPNSATGAGRGIKLSVNKNDNTAERAAVNVYAKNLVFSNNYSLQFDMWINYNGNAYGGTGSTEFGTFGINHSGNLPAWELGATSVPLTASDGVWFAVTGEAGAAGDYRSYEGDPGGNPLRYQSVEGGFLDRDGDGQTESEAVSTTPADYPLNLMFPSPPYETLGVPGKRWIQVEIRQKDGVITWLMNGYVIAEKQNLSQWTAGTIMLGTMDPFASIADPRGDNFVIFDNVRVSQLEVSDELPRIALEVTNAEASEPNNTGTIVFSRTGPTTNPLTVNFSFIGTAKAGEDFKSTNSLTIPAGAASANFTITPIDDVKAEPVETIKLVLQPAITNYEIFTSLLATVNLSDDGDVTLVTATVADPVAFEGIPDEKGAISITRNGDPTGDLTVNLSVSGTAASGDFVAIPTTVTIPAGLNSVLVPVEPIARAGDQGERTVIVTVSPGQGYAPGTPSAGTVTIKEGGAVLFSTDFETDESANWTVRFGANNSLPDYTAAFGYDYSADSVPASPHASGGTTKGLKMTVNKADTNAAIAGVNVYPNGKSFSGNYMVKFDMFLTYNASAAGTTEHSMFGINHSGNITNRHDTAGSDGVWFAVETDASGSGGGRSFTVYTSTNSTAKPLFTAKSFTGFVTAFPSPPALKAGTPSAQWSDVVIAQENNVVTLTINGTQLFQITNTTAFTAGDLMLGYMDSFASIGSPGNYVIYDNLRVYALPGGTIPVAITLSKNLTLNAGKVVIPFSATGAQASQLKVESSATVNGPYTADTTATVREVSAGQFEATANASSTARFYRVTN
jgi:hypothetical protein